MDQQPVYKLQDFDPDAVDLEKPATTVEEYMRQVHVNRRNCPDVVVANIDPAKIKSISSSIVRKEPDIPRTCQFAPEKEWQEDFAVRFNKNRERISSLRCSIPKIDMKKLPKVSNSQVWKKLCLVQRNENVPIEENHIPIFAKHRGTPPTTRLVLSFTDSQIDSLIDHLISAFNEIGYTRPLFEWIYAVLLVVQTPINHDVMSLLREFARCCRQARSKLTEDQKELAIEYTMFIAIMDDDENFVLVPRKAVSSGEPSLDGSVDEERGVSDSEIPRIIEAKELARQVKSPSSDELEAECERHRIRATKEEIKAEHDECSSEDEVDEDGFEDILGSGALWKKVIKEGAGERPNLRQWVTVRISSNTNPEDEHEDLTFPLGFNYVIEAWELTIQLMIPGEISAVKCESRLAYGEAGFGLNVPSNAPQEYEIELLSLGNVVDFDDMKDKDINKFFIQLMERSKYFFKYRQFHRAHLMNKTILDIIQKELSDRDFKKIHVDVLTNMAYCYEKLKEERTALEYVEKALQLDPSRLKLKVAKYTLLMATKEYDEAFKILTELVNNQETADFELFRQDYELCKKLKNAQFQEKKLMYRKMVLGSPKPRSRPPQEREASQHRRKVVGYFPFTGIFSPSLMVSNREEYHWGKGNCYTTVKTTSEKNKSQQISNIVASEAKPRNDNSIDEVSRLESPNKLKHPVPKKTNKSLKNRLRGRPRVFNNEERRKYQQILEKKTKIDENVRKYREQLCDYCLNIVSTTLRRIEAGEDFIYLRHICQNKNSKAK